MANAGLDPYECGCGWLEKAANDPSVPIAFDSEVNEYYLEMTGGRMVIRFCPWCGGDAPVSHRDSLFEVVTPDEIMRLKALTSHLRTRDDVIRAWGQPDEEIRSGYSETGLELNGVPSPTVSFDLMRYNNLSQTVVMDVILRADDRVMFSHSPKPRHK